MKTKLNGLKSIKKRHSALEVHNKDDKFDYSFRRKSDIEQGGGVDIYGYEPVNEGNNSGEFAGFSLPNKVKTKGGKQIVYQDTILCRRPKEISEHFKLLEDDKYNAGIKFVRSVANGKKQQFREMGVSSDEAFIKDESNFKGGSMTQRKGTTIEKQEKEIDNG